jgi:single-strand DNA-binding protein
MSLNRIVLVGRLVRDPEQRTTTTGKNVSEFTIAVDKRLKPRDENAATADFFRCIAWSQTSDYITNFGSKGRLVSVDGRIESRKYVDKDGNNRESWEVTVDQVSLLDRPRDDNAPAAVGSRPSGGTAPAPDEYDPFADE